jgi:hypothetical protein
MVTWRATARSSDVLLARIAIGHHVAARLRAIQLVALFGVKRCGMNP